MALIDHDQLLIESLDSPEAVAEYLNEAFETLNDAYVTHAFDIVPKIGGNSAFEAVEHAANLQKELAPLHVGVRFEPIGHHSNE
jgi:DNA-binding phage protein